MSILSATGLVTVLYIGIFLFAWFFASVVWLWNALPRKHSNKKSPWWEWVLSAPIFVLACAVAPFARRSYDKK